MKKTLILIIALLMLTNVLPVLAQQSYTAEISCDSFVLSDNDITLSLVVDGRNISSVEGTLEYNDAELELVSYQSQVNVPWIVRFNESDGTISAYDNNLDSSINGSVSIISFTFKVLAPVGTTTQVAFDNIVYYTENSRITPESVVKNILIREQLSNNNLLSFLEPNTGRLSPSFKADITDYTLDISYMYDDVTFTSTLSDSRASVEVIEPEYIFMGQTVYYKFIVTAENGDKKTYTVKVHRGIDTANPPSDNCNLQSLTVDGYTISPKFSKNTDLYLVWLPYEQDSICINVKTEDENAIYKISECDKLISGADNEITVTCYAQDGTAKVYRLIARRAADEPIFTSTPTVAPQTTQTKPASDNPHIPGEIDRPRPSEIDLEPEPPNPVENTGNAEPQQPKVTATTETTNITDSKNNDGVPVWLFIVSIIILSAVALVCGIIFHEKLYAIYRKIKGKFITEKYI